MMIEAILLILNFCFEILFSVQFGALLISIGSIIYVPTGNRLGKYSIIIGFFIFSLRNLSL